MIYTPRTTLPSVGNKYYMRKPDGWNPCILGNSAHRNKQFNVLPNCVGWAVGRFNEIVGQSNCKWLGSTNAKNFVSLAKSQGLEIGDKPKLGSIIVWSSSGAGHVAVVEDIIEDDEILVSQSGWSASKSMWTATHKKGTGSWTEGDDYSWMKNKYTFLGFIYNPAVDESTRPALARGSKSIFVRQLQEDLYTLGYKEIYVDGSFGPVLDKTVRDFQTKHGITADGKVGLATYSALDAALIDKSMPEGVFELEFLLNSSKTSIWSTKIEGHNYVRLDELDELGIVKSVSYDSIKKMPVITTK